MNKTSKTPVDLSLLFPASAEILTIYRSCPSFSNEGGNLVEAMTHISGGKCESCAYNARAFKEFGRKF